MRHSDATTLDLVCAICDASRVYSRTVDRYVTWSLELASASAALANFCDHVEHNEAADRAWVVDTGQTLRGTACEIATLEGVDLHQLYAERLTAIERRNPLWSEERFDGANAAGAASTWRGLQLAQAEHDRWYHPDVVGLSKSDQLRHYALHVAKLCGATADAAREPNDRSDFVARRLPDLLLFGLKLATVVGQKLPEASLTEGDILGELVAV